MKSTNALRILGVALEPQGKLILLGDEVAGAVTAARTPGAASLSILQRNGGATLLAFVALRNKESNLQIISYDTNLD